MARYSPPPVPAGISPEIAAAWAEYFGAFARTGCDDATDDDTDLAVDEMDIAASRLALVPCRSLHDIAAKAEFALYTENVLGGLAAAEEAVRTSALAAVVGQLHGDNGPDDELLRLFDLWAEAMRQHDALMALANDLPEDEAAEEAWLAQERPVGRAIDEAADAIAATPARTVIGLQIKAKVLKRYFAEDGADPIERSLLDDILALECGRA